MMMYTVVCAVFLGATSAQIIPAFSEYKCSRSQASTCDGLQSSYGTYLLALPGLGSSSFTCSDEMGFCSLSCSDDSACTAVNGLGVGMEKSSCTSGVCSVDLSCSTSDDCVDKISALPTCESGVCVAKQPTVQPTPPPVTAQPAQSPVTKAPVTASPVTAAPLSCTELCANEANDAKFCEVDADDFNNLYVLPCTEARNECEAKCLIQEGKDEAIAENPAYAQLIDSSIDVDTLYIGYCAKKTCEATTAPPTTKPPTRDPDAPTKKVTPSPTVDPDDPDADECAGCLNVAEDYKYCAVDITGIFSFPCTEARNECEAKCLIAAGIDDARVDYPTIDQYINADTAFNLYCKLDSCDTDPDPDDPDSPTVKATPVPTTDPDTDNDSDTDDNDTDIGAECEAQCESEGQNFQYCEVDLGALFSFPCTRARNECEAKCMIEAGLIDAGAEDYITVDNAFATYCALNSCQGRTTETPVTDPDDTDDTDDTDDPDTDLETTATPDCDDDDSYLRFDCPDESGEGCSIQAELTLDVCLLNFKFGRRAMYKLIKEPLLFVIEEQLSGYTDFCGETELSVEAYAVTFKDEAARLRGQKFRDGDDDEDCEDATAVCGDARDEFGVTVSVSVGLYCGDCESLKGLYTGLLGLLSAGTFDVGYVDQCLAQSLIEDGICFDGFGGVQIDTARMVMVDEDGVEIPNTEVNASGASMRSLVMVAVALMVSMW